MKLKNTLLALFFLLAASSSMKAQESKFIGGNSLSIIIPQGTLSDTYDHGLGFYGHLDYNISKNFALRFDLGWNDIAGPESEYLDSDGNIVINHPERTIWEVTAGARVKVSILYIEARGGYFSGENALGFVPAVGLRLGNFDLQGNYTSVGDTEYIGIRLGYYWGKGS